MSRIASRAVKWIINACSVAQGLDRVRVRTSRRRRCRNRSPAAPVLTEVDTIQRVLPAGVMRRRNGPSVGADLISMLGQVAEHVLENTIGFRFLGPGIFPPRAVHDAVPAVARPNSIVRFAAATRASSWSFVIEPDLRVGKRQRSDPTSHVFFPAACKTLSPSRVGVQIRPGLSSSRASNWTPWTASDAADAQSNL